MLASQIDSLCAELLPGGVREGTELGVGSVAGEPGRSINRVTTPLDVALDYGRLRWPVFPCHWQGPRRKQPLMQHGFRDATRDEKQIRARWTRWPKALIGMPTGKASGIVVADVDVKDDRANGYDTP